MCPQSNVAVRVAGDVLVVGAADDRARRGLLQRRSQGVDRLGDTLTVEAREVRDVGLGRGIEQEPLGPEPLARWRLSRIEVDIIAVPRFPEGLHVAAVVAAEPLAGVLGRSLPGIEEKDDPVLLSDLDQELSERGRDVVSHRLLDEWIVALNDLEKLIDPKSKKNLIKKINSGRKSIKHWS